MRPIDTLPEAAARRIDTVVFDLDDTVLDHGSLGEAAYRAMFRLREVGLDLVACTGRPASWAELVLRQWPVSAALAENGAVAWTKQDGVPRLSDSVAADERKRRREAVEHAARIIERAHDLVRADDNAGRVTDLTFDIGEHQRVDAAVTEAARTDATRLGMRSFVSSVHLHLTLDTYDKASGFGALAMRRGLSPVRALKSALYIGDSGNDAPAFAAFGLTVGVANVAPFVRSLSVPPRWVTRGRMGEGFAELAEVVARLRR